MPLDANRPGVVLSPHPDDAVLSAFSVLVSSGPVHVVNICTALPTPGTLGTFDPVFGVTDSHALMRARLAEDVAALGVVGRTATNLDFLDDQYRTQPLSTEALRAALGPHLRGVGWLCAPAGIGAHPDHIAVRDVAVRLGRELGVQVLLYADLPYAIWAGWPHWVTGGPPNPRLVPEVRWRTDLDGVDVASTTDDLLPEPVALTPAEIDRKLAALACYESQFEALNAGPIDRLRNPRIIGFELRWAVRT